MEKDTEGNTESVDNKNTTANENKTIEDTTFKNEIKASNEIINKVDTQKDNISTNNDASKGNNTVVKPKPKPNKDIPIEKKPFKEFINTFLIPTLISEIKQKGFEIGEINLQKTIRPIAKDECWVIYCEITNICNFWLSFEKDDISSSKSISLSRPNQKPCIIESFLIDEKRITLKLIISRLLQRLNGQKLIGVN